MAAQGRPARRSEAGGGARRAEPVAVVDIGSNSGRVMVYASEAFGQLRILARASLRLGAGSTRHGRIPADAPAHALPARLPLDRARGRGPGDRRAGTSACATPPTAAFVARVRRGAGFEINVLSGVEEARYGFLEPVGGLPVDDGALRPRRRHLQIVRFRQRHLLGR